VQRPPTARVIVAFIGTQRHGALAWPSTAVRLAERWDRIDCRLKQLRAMDIGSRDGHRQWHTLAVYYDAPLAPQFATIR
jgi:hypothetical protein